MKKNLEKVVLVVGLLLVIVIAFFAESNIIIAKKDLLKMKFELDLRKHLFNETILVYQDPKDDYVFYYTRHDATFPSKLTDMSPVINYIHKANLRKIPNYLDKDISIFSHENWDTVIFASPIEKGTYPEIDAQGKTNMIPEVREIVGLGVYENKFIFRIAFQEHMSDVPCTDLDTYNDLFYVDTTIETYQEMKPYKKTPEIQKEFIDKSSKCLEDIIENYKKADIVNQQKKLGQ